MPRQQRGAGLINNCELDESDANDHFHDRSNVDEQSEEARGGVQTHRRHGAVRQQKR